MTIYIDGHPYYPGRAARSVANVVIVGKETHTFRLNRAESDAKMQTRVQERVATMQKLKVCPFTSAARCMRALRLQCVPVPQLDATPAPKAPAASPASERKERLPGESGKPSPDSAGKMGPPPEAKRRHTRGAAAGSAEELEAPAVLPPHVGQSSSMGSSVGTDAARVR